MGLEDRLAGEVAMNVSMEVLLDPAITSAALITAGRELAAMGAAVLLLGCTGMAHHRGVLADAVGLPVIEPTQAAAGLALAAVMGG